ncbi:hypothetical protein BDQ17DRAFT_109205 [Cyathus striatus]|nr:hypothetical protein BDQ17DRAFT_109205 [Cyathus striatus]
MTGTYVYPLSSLLFYLTLCFECSLQREQQHTIARSSPPYLSLKTSKTTFSSLFHPSYKLHARLSNLPSPFQTYVALLHILSTSS